MNIKRSKKRILITGARAPVALDLCRNLYQAGYKVWVADSLEKTLASYSNCIEKAYLVGAPRYQQDRFIQDILRIIEKHHIDCVIPTCEEVFYLARHRHLFPETCEVFCDSFEKVKGLHSKYRFIQIQKNLGLNIPKTFFLSKGSVLYQTPYSCIFKKEYSRFATQIIKLKALEKIPELVLKGEDSWVMQEYIQGKEYCCYAIAREGNLKAFACYPSIYTVNDGACVHFRSIDHAKIYQWVESFLEEINYTGQIGFDFIEGKDLYCIDANPRATSGLHLLCQRADFADAFFSSNTKCIRSKVTTKAQVLAGMLSSSRKFQKNFFKELFSSKDVLFSWRDLKPFLYSPLIYFFYWKLARALKLSINELTTHDIEWNGGD